MAGDHGLDWGGVHHEKRWTILRTQKRFFFWALYTSIGSMMLGFDFGIAGTATAYPAFQQAMGIPWPSQPSGYLIPAKIQSAWSGVSTVGDAIGILISGQLMDRIGRKWTTLIGAVFTCAGIGVQLRGFYLCLTNGSIVLGQFILSLVAYAAEQIDGKWSYQTLVVLQFVFAKALSCLERVHGRKDRALLSAEMARLAEVIRASEELAVAARAHGPLFLQIFRGINLKRTLIAILPIIAQQLIGAAFVLGYITYFLSQQRMRFPLIETAGRRPLLLTGMVALTIIELIMGTMGAIHHKAAIWVILVCIFLWAVFYQFSVGAVGFALGSEISSPPLRATTISFLGLTQCIVGWLIGFISPYLINPDAGNLGAKIGFIFAGMGFPCAFSSGSSSPRPWGSPTKIWITSSNPR
ncbi:unnamed protein product [Parascedosporium putredinis]|uniref:Uncharacterized protein n=1 Tax=Parascedosporium putredinis TaxID=1442378 RepID=A0A9P1GYI5_9PEZI|nr:unnamed protein product [Parascedosporium putredinis]CAI7991806.1 unnamed protein product [Parascedosporium putredinis]